eukprot:8141247-Pyramimonas_sp.AAC.1
MAAAPRRGLPRAKAQHQAERQRETELQPGVARRRASGHLGRLPVEVLWPAPVELALQQPDERL